MPYYIQEVEGAKELEKLLKDMPKIAERHMLKSMQLSTADVVANVKPLVPVFSGRLRNSIQSAIEGRGTKMTGLIGSTLKKEKYPAVMEFGRTAGAKMPPPSALVPWVRRVLKVSKKEEKGVAFIVARAIGKKGIKGKRFLQKGFKESQPKIVKYFNDGLTRIMREATRGS